MILLLGLALAAEVTVDRGVVVETDEGHRAELHLLVDQQLELSEEGPGWNLQRVRPDLRVGLATVPLKVRVQTELANTPSLLDATVDLGPDWLHLRVGRMLMPTGRAQLTPVPKLAFQGFSTSSNQSRVGRAVGAMALATGSVGEVQVGLFGEDANVVAVRGAVNVVGHVPYDELAVLTAGAPGLTLASWSRWEPGGAWVGVEAASRLGPVGLQAEAHWQAHGALGAYVQVVAAVVPERVSTALRVDRSVTEERALTTVDGVWSVHALARRVRLQAGWQVAQTDGRSKAVVTGRLATQLAY